MSKKSLSPTSIKFTLEQTKYLHAMAAKNDVPLSTILRGIINAYIEDMGENPVLLFTTSNDKKIKRS